MVIARILGPAGMGLFTVTFCLSSIIVAIFHGSLGIENANLAERYPESRPGLIGNSISIAVVWGGLVTILLVVLLASLRKLIYPDMTDRLWAIVFLSVIPLFLQELSNGLILGMNAVRRFTITLLGRDVLLLFLVILLANTSDLSTVGVASLWLVSAIIGAGLMLLQAIFIVGESPRIDVELLWHTAYNSYKSFNINILPLFLMSLGFLLIALFMTPSDVGYYSVAMAMVACIWFLPTAISQMLRPYISEFSIESGDELTAQLTRITLFIITVFAIIIGLSGYWLIRILAGPEYLSAYGAVLILLPGVVIYSLKQSLSNDQFGEENVHFNGIVTFLIIVLNIIAAVILIPKFGIAGAAAISSVTNSIVGLTYLHFFLSESGLGIENVIIPNRNDFRMIFRRDY